VIDWWINFSMELRLAMIVFVGVLIGPAINWAIYNAAYFPLPISPWRRFRFRELIKKHFEEVAKLAKQDLEKVDSRTSEKSNNSNSKKLASVAQGTTSEESLAHPTVLARVPIVGWLWLRNEESVFGVRFWLRPMLIELLLPIFMAWFYFYETTGGMLPRIALPLVSGMQDSLHLQAASHLLLCLFMCVATFIDFDERTIPDWVTIPGTLLGVISVTTFSLFAPVHLWTSAVNPAFKAWPTLLDWTSPYQVSNSVAPFQQLILGLACLAIWCFAIADRRVILRRGWRKGVKYFFAGLFRRPTWKLNALIFVVGLLSIFATWKLLPGPAWDACLNSLMGTAIGGILVWVVRIVATTAIGIEALGFGDVTLMFMVGAFLGWQPTWIAFFVAPIFAILIVLILYVITGDNQLPFGPYLCAGTLLTLIGWDELWNVRLQPMVSVIGFEMLILLLLGLLLMGLMLWSWRLLKQRAYQNIH